MLSLLSPLLDMDDNQQPHAHTVTPPLPVPAPVVVGFMALFNKPAKDPTIGNLSIFLLDWWLTSAWKSWSLLTKRKRTITPTSNQHKMDFIARKNVFCFFSKNTFSSSTAYLAEMDKEPKKKHLGFIFYCLIVLQSGNVRWQSIFPSPLALIQDVEL